MEMEEARRAVAAGGRTISPVVVEGEDPFDLHGTDLVEEFGVSTDRKKPDEKKPKYKVKLKS